MLTVLQFLKLPALPRFAGPKVGLGLGLQFFKLLALPGFAGLEVCLQLNLQLLLTVLQLLKLPALPRIAGVKVDLGLGLQLLKLLVLPGFTGLEVGFQLRFQRLLTVLQFFKLLVLPGFAGLEVGFQLTPHASHFRPQETAEAQQPRQQGTGLDPISEQGCGNGHGMSRG